jgi:McrBC 5-methylcytosine restriction system component
MARLGVSVQRDFDGTDVRLRIVSSSQVGAVPLVSPQSAKPEYGLVVQPRFPWSGIGPMLAEMGWRVAPVPLRLPLLRRSERRVPGWVLSFLILARVQALLERLSRRFEYVEDELRAPKGAVQWGQYAVSKIPQAGFLQIPCRFPDLRDDRHLKGAIRYTLERQIQSLETQREHGAFVHRLIVLADALLSRVRTVPSLRPTARQLTSWLRGPLRNESLADGLQAIEWTVDERGLAGMSDLEGVPWSLSMDGFFESWVETLFQNVVTRTGGELKVGRRRETVSPLAWEPAYLGSQKSLVPDMVLRHGDCTVIVDAKYKRHWEELQRRSWKVQPEELQEQHRHDLLQVLAYANLSDAPTTIACLVYPCTLKTWRSLRERGRLFHRAEVTAQSRQVRLWLTAVPMHAAVSEVATPIAEELRRVMVS